MYTNGAEGSYRDFWFPVWNSDVDSNETGAPFIRFIPFYIVVGNHDVGAVDKGAVLRSLMRRRSAVPLGLLQGAASML